MYNPCTFVNANKSSSLVTRAPDDQSTMSTSVIRTLTVVMLSLGMEGIGFASCLPLCPEQDLTPIYNYMHTVIY